jgi:hypothetical protein
MFKPLPAITHVLASLVMIVAATPAFAAEDAESLYQAHCTRCHGSEVYTRKDRKISSFDGLEHQVQRCELSLELQWFDESISAVSDDLNHHFYHFPR